MSTPAPLWLFPLAQFPTVSGGTATNPAPAAPVAPAAAPATPAANNTSTGQVATSQPPTTQPPADNKPGGMFGSLTSMLPIVLMFVVLYFVLFRGQKKEEKRRKALLSEMKKGDRVMTIGGLIGRVVSIDNDEVVLKIDESANVKATYKKSSIQQVLTPGEEKTK